MYDTPAEKLAGIIAADLVEYEEPGFYPWELGDKPFSTEIDREIVFVSADDNGIPRRFEVTVKELSVENEPDPELEFEDCPTCSYPRIVGDSEDAKYHVRHVARFFETPLGA